MLMSHRCIALCVLFVLKCVLTACTVQRHAHQIFAQLPSDVYEVSPNKGWFGEKMPMGMKQAQKCGEYIWNKTGSIMVYIPPDNEFAQGFYIDKYEITIGDFKRFVTATGYETSAEREGWSNKWDGRRWLRVRPNWRNPMEHIETQDNYPVIYMSWLDVNNYGRWAGKQVPTSIEWRRASGEGSLIPNWSKCPELVENRNKRRLFPWGNDAVGNNRCNHARTWETRSEDGFEFLAPVGSYPLGVSPYGCMDMGGNVCEWVADMKLCGGSWSHPTEGCQVDHYNSLRGSWPNGNNCTGGRLIVYQDYLKRH